jgi:hypothetical protein
VRHASPRGPQEKGNADVTSYAVPPARPATRPQHVLMLVLLLGLSFALYGQCLNNPYWHNEDYNVLYTAQSVAADPSLLLRLNALERHHPVPLALFLAEYRMFGLHPPGYYAVNIILNGLNAFLVYWLVVALMPDRRIAWLSGTLFVLGVGSYGKAVMFVAGAENLLITLLYLLILNLYIRNDIWQQGRVRTWRYALVLLLFLLASFAKPTAFSLVLVLLAYKIFLRSERGPGRALLEPNLVILVLGALAFWALREVTGVVDFRLGAAGRNPVSFTVGFAKNMVQYIIHMFFPIHFSRLVTDHPIVWTVYKAAPVIRFVIGLSILSYGLFGFVFGNRTIRFFIAYTLISLLPYAAIEAPQDWLNIRYLYQVAIGFVFLLSAGTILSMDLLHRAGRKKYLPFLVPLAFVLLSTYITTQLDTKYEIEGRSAPVQENFRSLQGFGQ